jgi:hypothetical protein
MAIVWAGLKIKACACERNTRRIDERRLGRRRHDELIPVYK